MQKSRSSRTVAFIDLGTNSARLMLVQINPDTSYRILAERKEVVRLGEGEFQKSKLTPAAMDRAILVMKEFVNMANSRGADKFVAVATSATREALNQRAFLTRLKSQTGLSLRVISGREEARLIYLGVVRDLHLKEQTAMIVDIGGGSTEIIVGDRESYHLLRSLPLGAIRISNAFPVGDGGVISEGEFLKITGYIEDSAVRVLQEIQTRWSSRIDLMVGTSGTVENLTDIAVQRFHNRRREPEDILSFEQLKKTITLLRQTPLNKRKLIPGINPERADIIVAGSAILFVIMKELNRDVIHINGRGLRDGLLFDYLQAMGGETAVDRISFRKESVLRLGRAIGFEEFHARHVSFLALQLFDSARRNQLHDLGDWERELLEYAALLHDIGISLSYDGHHRHSYYFIKHAELLGFTEQEIDIIAAVTRYHRKSVPRKKHPEFDNLSRQSQKIVTVLSVFMSIAESLDRSHAQLIDRTEFSKNGKKTILLRVHARKDCPLEKWGVEYHRESFRKALKHRLKVETYT
jgi:exopolyphosphatase/guanosine-5'-triphosphate,3'-diphosphate pyrophosphatase